MSFLYPSPSTCLFLSAWLNVLLCPDPAGQASSQGQAKDYKTDCQTAANGEQEIPQEAPPTGCRGQSSKSVTDSHQKDVKNHFMYNMLQVWHLLPTLCSLQPQSTIPDAFIWLLSGNKRLAYVRIPAYSILFSLVEEQRGRDCGKVSTLYMKVTIPSLVISETHDNLL